MERRQDLSVGLIFALIGLAAAWLGRSYSGAGGTYPMALGLALALFGAIIAARALRSAPGIARTRTAAPHSLAVAVIVAAGYVALVMPLGFFTASAALMLVMPLALGFRRPVYLAVMAAVFMALVWLVFAVVLEKPLPAEFWSSVRRDG
jgi:putative tricarboxylic transport membrane protein